MAPDDVIRQRIRFLYGPEVSAGVATRIEALLVQFEAADRNRPNRDVSMHEGGSAQEPSNARAAQPGTSHRRRFPTQRDVVLITYGDQVTAAPAAPLAVLKQFLDRWAAGLVSTVHLLPFFPYSSDDGFSVIDYLAVDPRLGGWDDVAAIGSRFALMFDAVLNHVSAESAWFKGYLAGRSPYRDYFIEVPADADLDSVMRPRTTPLLTSFTTAAGVRNVWTTFGPDQIDLDYANPDVLLEMLRVLLGYVERGAELLRLDAVTYLWKEVGTTGVHHPKTHGVIKLLRSLLDRVAPHVTLITETNVPHRENVAYFGDGHDEAQMVYNFALPPLMLHALSTGDARKFNTWAEDLRTPSNETCFFNYLASHDGIGVRAVEGILDRLEIDALATRALQHGGFVSAMPDGHGGERPYELNINLFDALNDPRAAEPRALQVARFLCAHAVMVALAGVPGLYVHSLVGSRGDPEAALHSGHARAINRKKLPLDDLERELLTPSSLRNPIYDGLRTLLEVRRQERAFDPRAPQRVLDLGPELIAIQRTRSDGSAAVYCLQNVRDQPQEVTVAATGLEDMLTLPNTPPLSALDQTTYGRTRVTLAPYGVRWLVGSARQAPEHPQVDSRG